MKKTNYGSPLNQDTAIQYSYDNTPLGHMSLPQGIQI